MNAQKSVAAVVSPFGILGGRYEVDAGGLKLYRISWIVAIMAIVTSTVVPFFGAPEPIRYAILGIGFVVSLLLCITVIRSGTKL